MKHLLLLFALLVAAPATAVDRTSTADFYWNGVTTGSWTGVGTPAITDDFTCNHTIVANVNPALTSGSFIIGAGCRMIIPPGITFQYGDGSGGSGLPTGLGARIDTGGTLHQEGALMRTCRIAAPPDWSAAVSATHTVSATLDCDLTGISTTTDYVFFGDEDPLDLDATLNGRCVYTGPGLAPPGCHRPAFNKWASYKVATGTTGRTLVWDLDAEAGNYTASPNAPYAGSRYAPAATAITSAQLNYVSRWLARRTLVTVANAYSTDVAVVAGDRGSWYLAYDEVPSVANDQTSCSGLHSKVLHSTTGADDTLELDGDVSGCTHASATARLTTGARRGDIVHIYRPSTINGDTNGSGPGEGAIANAGGHWYARFARIHKPWGIAGTGWSPIAVRAGSVQFIQGTATAQPTADWEWVDIAYPGFTGGGDVGVLHFVSATSSADLRYPNNGLLDMTGSRFRRIHIHDSFNNAAGGGGHGIYVDSARGVDIAQVRFERMNDDCIGASMVRSNGSVVQPNGMTLRHVLNYECIAETENSQQGIEIVVEAGDGSGTDNPGLSTQFTLQDTLSIGHDSQPLGVQLYGATLKGVTTGGIKRSQATANVFVRIGGIGAQSTLTDATIGAQALYGNLIYDSNLYTLGPTTSNAHPDVGGYINGSFIAGNDQVGTATARPVNIAHMSRTVVDNAAGNSGAFLISGSNSSPFYSLRASFVNTIFRSTTAGGGGETALAQNLAPSTGGFQHTIRRLGLLIVNPATNANNGLLVSFAVGGSIANATTTVDGLFVTNSSATNAGNIVQTGSGVVVDVQAACMETTATIGTVFAGTGPSATKIPMTTLPPSNADTVLLRDLVAKPTDSGCRGRSLPLALGYENYRVGHAMLGDFHTIQHQRSSSQDLISAVGAPAQTSCGSGGRWPCN